MSSRDRHELARRTFTILTATLTLTSLLGLFGGAALNRVVTGVAEPPTCVLLPVGLGLFLVGLHYIYFRDEDAALQSAWRTRWGLPGYAPWECALWGIVAMLLALCFMAVGVRAVIDGLR